MSAPLVDIRELVAWDLDEYSFRESSTEYDAGAFLDKVDHARQQLSVRAPHRERSPVLPEATERLQHLLKEASRREDMQEEYRGLDWTLGVVDLRCLLAFQRRLSFHSARNVPPVPQQQDWGDLTAFAFGSARSTQYRLKQYSDSRQGFPLEMYSYNPDLQLRLTMNSGCSDSLPLALHGGSPFLEVAGLRGRWFLRDGYHRAYLLLRAGVHTVPAVIVHARTVAELSATEPWFFHDAQLFSDRPPQVMDFLNEEMTFCYRRTALCKVIRICVEESLEPFDQLDEEQGDEL